ncbi:pyridoxine 5'-phosphate synthase [Candidatus Calescamantes bacterium]|nr:pyridoxine 5'-phosphate synthase [Candidatus Calescamantes bacterium]
MPKLGVNIDHVATLREARKVSYPDPVQAAVICEQAGAHGIVAHLREDRRHVKERDIFLLKEIINIKFNLEMAPTQEIREIALKLKPDQVTLVPERRQELTTEGGLDVVSLKDFLKEYIKPFKDAGIIVSLFIDPETSQIEAAKETGAQSIEIHTGEYANLKGLEREKELEKIIEMSEFAHKLGFHVHAGHGLNYWNVKPIAKIPVIEELNIGHSIISRAVYVGLERAVREMLQLIR